MKCHRCGCDRCDNYCSQCGTYQFPPSWKPVNLPQPKVLDVTTYSSNPHQDSRLPPIRVGEVLYTETGLPIGIAAASATSFHVGGYRSEIEVVGDYKQSEILAASWLEQKESEERAARASQMKKSSSPDKDPGPTLNDFGWAWAIGAFVAVLAALAAVVILSRSFL